MEGLRPLVTRDRLAPQSGGIEPECGKLHPGTASPILPGPAAAGRRTSLTVAGQAAVIYSFDWADRLTRIIQGNYPHKGLGQLSLTFMFDPLSLRPVGFTAGFSPRITGIPRGGVSGTISVT